MTKVFVHGNPETSAVWDDLISELARRGVTDIMCLTPPGFGAPTPRGWGATQSEYAAWLTAELSAIDGPVDLVSHDWGAGHAFGVLADNPMCVRSWASDCLGLMHPDYVWHDMAQVWQLPEAGEQAAAALVGMEPDQFAAALGPAGMGDVISRKVSSGLDEESARCILALYRSAAQPAMAELGRRFVAAAPSNGLVVIAENDHYAGTDAMHAEMASAVGADVVRLAGVGHWWMVEDPTRAADALIAHWSR